MRGGLRVTAFLLSHPRFEVIPTKSVEDVVVEWVPREVTMTVTSSPRMGIDATIELAESLSQHGYRVVPHLAARLVVDEAHLKEIVGRLTACGIDDIFVPAGDADAPVGRFDSALSLLTELDILGRPFAHMGITGYPESHSAISDDVTIQAMWDKRHYATYIVSNLCFDAATVRHWIRRVRSRGVALPIFFGLAGPVDRSKLLNVATKIGVGESARFLTGHAGWFLRMGTPGGYDPSRLLDRMGAVLADPASMVEGVHVFTFNQIHQTERWRQGVVANLVPETRSRSQSGN